MANMTELLISSDGHAKVSHEAVKEHLASKYHRAYDDAVDNFTRQLMSLRSSTNNQAWESTRRVAESADSFRMRNMSRDGHSNGQARLADMDIDGVQAEVLYCEVSGFRYLYSLTEGSYEASKAFNDAMHEFASADPSRLIMSYQIPINDIGHAIKEVHRAALPQDCR
jgi:uncharacterized protein